MSLTMPSNIAYTVSDFRPYSPNMQSVSDSLKAITELNVAHRYECRLNVVPRRFDADARDVAAFNEALEGRKQYLVLQIPHHSKCRGALSGSVTVGANANKGAKQITLSTPIVSTQGVVRAGDCFVFGSHTKVYKALYDADSDGSGDVDVILTLHLLKDITVGTTVVYDNVPFTMRQKEDRQSFDMRAGTTHVGFSYDLEEVV